MLRTLGLTILALCASGAALAQVFPSGKEMPPAIKALHQASGGQLDDQSRCEVIDWVADPANAWPAGPSGPVDVAKHQADICVMSLDDLTPEAAAKRLAGENFRFDIEGGVMTILAKSSEPEVSFCCAPSASLSRLGDSDYWGARYRIRGADRAMVSQILTTGPVREDLWRRYRGPNAPPRPVEVGMGKWKGQMLERELKSDALGETRRLSIYLPPGYAKDRSWPALFMADAGAIEFAGLVEAMIQAGEIRPIVIISAESGERGIVGEPPAGYLDLRAAEYLPNWRHGTDRFTPHMTFFAKEVVDYAVTEFGVSLDLNDRAVGGKSNGGVFALWAGVLKPDVFANAIPMSPGWNSLEAGDVASGQRARFFISAGMYEPKFIMSAQNSEAVLKAAGYKVTGRYYAAGHMHDQWAVALREALLDIFPAR
jgi:enterochelin esterase-like enzyme